MVSRLGPSRIVIDLCPEFDSCVCAYSGDREQGFHAIVNSAWSRKLEIEFLRQVFTIRQADAVSHGSSGSWICLSFNGEDRSAVSPAVRPGRSSGICGRSKLAHRVARHLELDTVALVHESIEDRIGE